MLADTPCSRFSLHRLLVSGVGRTAKRDYCAGCTGPTLYSWPMPLSSTVLWKQSAMPEYDLGDTAIRVRTVSSGKHSVVLQRDVHTPQMATGYTTQHIQHGSLTDEGTCL
jgi:hypothetical protein